MSSPNMPRSAASPGTCSHRAVHVAPPSFPYFPLTLAVTTGPEALQQNTVTNAKDRILSEKMSWLSCPSLGVQKIMKILNTIKTLIFSIFSTMQMQFLSNYQEVQMRALLAAGRRADCIMIKEVS